MSTASLPQRRTLRFHELSDILDDVRMLRAGEYRTVGQWSFAQILEHLANGVNFSFDGYGFRAPWILRTFAPLLKNRFLTKPMSAGFKLPKSASAMLPRDDTGVDEAAEALETAIARFATEVPSHPHPVFGMLTKEEYVLLHLRHSELHLSFVVPVETNG